MSEINFEFESQLQLQVQVLVKFVLDFSEIDLTQSLFWKPFEKILPKQFEISQNLGLVLFFKFIKV
jgi:hypothetical protein